MKKPKCWRLLLENKDIIDPPEGYKVCPECDGGGDFDEWMDCLGCDGKGYILEEEV